MKKILFLTLFQAIFLPAMAENELNDSSRVHDLDEITVVSQPKESFRLRQQPLSSSVFSRADIERLQIRDLRDLSAFVPSFTMPNYGSRYTSSMYVRGIGSRINNPAVGVYYDNIPLMSKAAFNNHFYMLDRVDILRGPQGTLYGQNTEGGLVRVYSKDPFNYQGTDVQLSLGTGLYSNVEVAHHHRPSEKLAFTVAGFYSGLKGFIDNQNFKEKNDLSNEAGAKIRLIFQPNRQLKFDWMADYQYVNQNGFGYGEDNQDPATTIMNGYKRNMLNTGLNIAFATEKLLFTSATSYQFLQDQMPMDQDYMTPDYLLLEQRQKMNALTQEFVLRSRNSTLNPQPSTFTWQHATGLFGSYQWLRTDAPVSFGDAITAPIGNAISTAMKNAMIQSMVAQGMPEAAARAAVEQMGITMSAEMAVPESFKTPQMNFAVFHESNFQLANRLKLTLGLRFNVDRVKIEYDALAYMNMTGGTAGRVATYHLTSHVADSRAKTYTQLLPKFGLTYNFSGNLGNVYAIVSKGYRSGGYNIQMFSDILQTDLNANQQKAMRGDFDVAHSAEDYDNIEKTISYKPEESWNYEIGTHLNLFDSQIHLDLALFYMQIRNQQLSVMEPNSNYGRMMVNAGKSHSCGLEATLRGRAFDNALDWAVGYGFTNAKFDEYEETENLRGFEKMLIHHDFSGNYVPFVPSHTMSALADWHIGHFTVGANLAGQGKTWWDEANTFAQKFYVTLGAHADYDFGPVVVSLWARNLTDTKYNTFAVQSSAAGGTRYFAQRANPFHAGIDLRLHF